MLTRSVLSVGCFLFLFTVPLVHGQAPGRGCYQIISEDCAGTSTTCVCITTSNPTACPAYAYIYTAAHEYQVEVGNYDSVCMKRIDESVLCSKRGICPDGSTVNCVAAPTQPSDKICRPPTTYDQPVTVESYWIVDLSGSCPEDCS